MPPSSIVAMGLAHVPEGRQVFTRMTVAENMMMGAYFRKDLKAVSDDLEKVYHHFPRLKERAKQLNGISACLATTIIWNFNVTR